MALNDDASTYDSYEETVKRLLAEVDTSLKALRIPELFLIQAMKNMQQLFLNGETSVILSWKRLKMVIRNRR